MSVGISNGSSRYGYPFPEALCGSAGGFGPYIRAEGCPDLSVASYIISILCTGRNKHVYLCKPCSIPTTASPAVVSSSDAEQIASTAQDWPDSGCFLLPVAMSSTKEGAAPRIPSSTPLSKAAASPRARAWISSTPCSLLMGSRGSCTRCALAASERRRQIRSSSSRPVREVLSLVCLPFSFGTRFLPSS